MASPIEAILILCDAATVDPLQKVHILGAGWSITSSPTAPSAVVAFVKIPWDRTNKKLETSLQLLDEDGGEVVMHGVALRSDRLIEVGRPPGLEEGTPIDFNFQLSIPSLQLPPGRYSWVLRVADSTHQTSFQVRQGATGEQLWQA